MVFVGHHAPFRAFLPAEYQIQPPHNPFHCPSLLPLSDLSPAQVVQMDMHMVMEVVASVRDWGAICQGCRTDGEAKAFSVAERAT